MAEESKKTMGDYIMEERLRSIERSIVPPAVEAESFELNPELINIIHKSIQFGGLPTEDPGWHLQDFLMLCDTFKYKGVSHDAVTLRLFPFSLRDRASLWLRSLPPRSITTWNQLVTQFMAKFPPSKLAKWRVEIASFAQLESESLYEVWERFQDLLRRCPFDHQRLPKWEQARVFFEGLTPINRLMVDAVVGDNLLRENNPTMAYDLMDEMYNNGYQGQPGVLAMDTNIAIWKQLEPLTKQVESLMRFQNRPPQPQP